MTEIEGWNAIASQIEGVIDAVVQQIRAKTYKTTTSRLNLMKLDKKLTGALEFAKKAADEASKGGER